MAAPSGSFDEARPPAAGPAAAAVLALAAGLAELTAGLAGDEALVARARTLRGEAEALGRDDAQAYAELLADGGEAARERTIELPSQMAELSVQIGELAALATELGRRDSRYDAIAGALLAETAARVACLLVEANLGGEPDARLEAARDAARRASAAAQRALAATTLPARG